MHRYEIFLNTGMIVEFEAESVNVMLKENGTPYGYEFIISDPAYISLPKAVFFNENISGWVELSRNKERREE